MNIDDLLLNIYLTLFKDLLLFVLYSVMNNKHENLELFLAPHTHLIKCNKRLPKSEFSALPKSLEKSAPLC